MCWQINVILPVLYHRFTQRCVSFHALGTPLGMPIVWSLYRITQSLADGAKAAWGVLMASSASRRAPFCSSTSQRFVRREGVPAGLFGEAVKARWWRNSTPPKTKSPALKQFHA